MARISALLPWAGAAISSIGRAGRPVTPRRPPDLTPWAERLGTVPVERRRQVAALVVEASASRLADHLAAGRFTAVELVAHYLERIAAHEWLHALIELNPHLWEEAAASDTRRAAGAAWGRLDGIPVALKDNIETDLMRTTGGADVLAENRSATDAPVVNALRRAGAVILGKANLSELAGGCCRTPGVSAVGGATVNPYGSAFSPGGSSSGSAVAVAAGLCPVAIGTETSGSLIAPAAFNGVIGFKPTFGIVSDQGVIPLVRFQDCVGPMTTTVADAALVFAALTDGPVAELRPDALNGVNVAILADEIAAQPAGLEDTADNPAMLERMRDGFSAAGANVSETSLVVPPELANYEGRFFKVVIGGLTTDTMAYLAAHSAITSVSELVRFNLARPAERMPKGQFYLHLADLLAISPTTYEAAAQVHRDAAQTILSRTFAESGAQLLVSITNQHSALYAGAGYPAISVPLGLRRNGMPTAATLIGRLGEDAQLLSHAAAFEQATKLRRPPQL